MYNGNSVPPSLFWINKLKILHFETTTSVLFFEETAHYSQDGVTVVAAGAGELNAEHL
jgi:hypothetical protein